MISARYFPILLICALCFPVLGDTVLQVKVTEQYRISGLFFGFLSAMVLTNLVLYFSSRAKTYFWYSLYVACLAGSISAFNKSLHLGWLHHTVTTQVLVVAGLIALAQFSRHLLRLDQRQGQLGKVPGIISLASLVAGSLSLVLDNQNKLFLLSAVILASLALLACIGLLLWQKGRNVQLFTLATSIMFVCTLMAMFDYLGHSPLPGELWLMLGAILDSSLLTSVVAVDFAQERKEKLEAQQQALERAREVQKAQQENLQLQLQTQEDLESMVSERTLELEFALRELEEKNQALEEATTRDALTGVRNRRFFDKRMQAEMRRARREQSPLSLLMLDIDHFKKVNDNYGHPAGDEVLKFVANAMKSQLKRPSDSVCRYGGEEFAVLLPNTPIEGASALAENIRSAVEAAEIPTMAGTIQVTLSLGVNTQYIGASLDPTDFIQDTDQALYQAKQNGRNRVAIASSVTPSPYSGES